MTFLGGWIEVVGLDTAGIGVEMTGPWMSFECIDLRKKSIYEYKEM